MHDEFLCVHAWCDVKGIVLVVGMQGGEEKMSCGGGLARLGWAVKGREGMGTGFLPV